MRSRGAGALAGALLAGGVFLFARLHTDGVGHSPRDDREDASRPRRRGDVWRGNRTWISPFIYVNLLGEGRV